MSIREGSYTIPAQAGPVMRAARMLRSAFDDVFRWVQETERAMPRRSVRRFCDRITAGEQPSPVCYRRVEREDPGPKTPDGDKYCYRIHTVDVRITGGFGWRDSDVPGRQHERVLAVSWHMESTYVYHATVDGEDVSGTLQDVWEAQLAAKRRQKQQPTDVRTEPEHAGREAAETVIFQDWHYPSGDTFPMEVRADA